MVIFHFGKKKYGPVPGSYNELSAKQLIEIARLFTQELPEDVARLQALKVLLNKSLFAFGLISTDAKEKMLYAIHPDEPLAEDGKEQKFFIDWVFEKNQLTENILQSYKGYYGPQSEFNNLTLQEFHHTEVNYYQLVNGDGEEKEEALNKLVAVLYRKPKLFYNQKRDKDGDIRKPFNANELAYYAAKVASWPAKVKTAIVMYYDGCRQLLVSTYDGVFNGDDGAEHEAGMFEMIRGLSGNKYGDFDKVEHLNVHTALFEIEKTLLEVEALKIPTL